jgi:hypothetical protein
MDVTGVLVQLSRCLEAVILINESSKSWVIRQLRSIVEQSLGDDVTECTAS